MPSDSGGSHPLDLREQLAAIEHERWADWQRYMHSKCRKEADGGLTIPADLAARWERQIATPYEELSEQEKQSDRDQVDRYWPLVEAGLSDADRRGWHRGWDEGIQRWSEFENRLASLVPEHYEAGYNAVEDWATDADKVISAAHAWRKCGRTEADGDKLNAAVEKIYPTGVYL